MPGNRLSECLIERDWFTISEFLTDTRGIEEKILIGIQLDLQTLGKTLFWQRDDGSLPSCHLANRLHPLVESECGFIANVVDTTSGTRICYS